MKTITKLAPLSCVLFATGAMATIDGQFQVRLSISAGCEISTPGHISSTRSASAGGVLDPGVPYGSHVLFRQRDPVRLLVMCNPSVTGFNITIDGGAHRDGSTRRLSNGTQSIPYQLFFDVAGNDRYEIGQQRTVPVRNGGQVPIPIYSAAVSDRRALLAGIYSDTLLVTLDW